MVLGSRQHQVQVIAEGEQTAVSLLGRGRQRLLPTPGLHDDSLRQIRMQYLVPSHHDFVMLAQDLLQALIEVGLQKLDRKSTRLNSSHQIISYAVFCLAI